jgi:hypothetical protein
MDIIFQNGDFYGVGNSFWSDLISIFSSLLGALISGLIAIYILKKGIRVQVDKKIEEKIKSETETEEFVVYQTKFLQFAIKAQVTEISNTIENLKDYNSKDFLIGITSYLSTEEILTIPNKEIFRIFVSNRVGNTPDKSADYLNFKSSLRFINQQIEHYDNYNKKILLETEPLRDLWNNGLKNLLNLYNEFEYESTKSINRTEDIFLNEYRKIIVEEQRKLISEGKSNNIVDAYNRLIIPLVSLSSEHKAPDSRIIAITPHIISCSQSYLEMVHLRKQKRRTLIKWARNLMHSGQLLKECIEYLQKREKTSR